MSTPRRKSAHYISPWFCCAALLLASALASTLALAETPAPTPNRTPRSANVLSLQLQDLDVELDNAGAKAALTKQDARATVGAVAVPLLKKQNLLIEELGRADAAAGAAQQFKVLRNMAMMATLGDEDMNKRLNGLVKNAGPAQSFYAKMAATMRDWWISGADASAQAKIITPIKALAKQAPKDELLTSCLLEMMWVGSATKELATQIEDVIYKDMKSESALRYKSVPRVGRPFLVTGVALVSALQQPAPFTSEKWKGKVILMHVWSTGHTGSRQQMEMLKKKFTELNPLGLEILGIANEANFKDLQAYVADKQVTWPQLVDPKNPNWQTIMNTWQVPHLSTIYLIDRLGIVRAINPAPDKSTELLAELIEEKLPAATMPKK